MSTDLPLNTTSQGPRTSSKTVSNGRQTASWNGAARAVTARSLSSKSISGPRHARGRLGNVAARRTPQDAGFVLRFQQGALDLAAAGALHRPRGRDHHLIDLQTHAVDDAPAYLHGELRSGEFALGFHHDHHALAVSPPQPAHPERDDIARAHPRGAADRPLQALGI